MNARAVLTALILAGLVPLSGCLGSRYAEVPSTWGAGRGAAPEGEPIAERRAEYWERDTQRPRRIWYVRFRPGEPALLHGSDRAWWADGTPNWEREHDRGRPSGTWRTWYADGTPRSECTFAGPSTPAPARWWHPNGSLSSEGPALDGLRHGAWREYDEAGRLAAAGEYRAGRREGEWLTFGSGGLESGQLESGLLQAEAIETGAPVVERRIWRRGRLLRAGIESERPPDK